MAFSTSKSKKISKYVARPFTVKLEDFNDKIREVINITPAFNEGTRIQSNKDDSRVAFPWLPENPHSSILYWKEGEVYRGKDVYLTIHGDFLLKTPELPSRHPDGRAWSVQAAYQSGYYTAKGHTHSTAVVFLLKNGSNSLADLEMILAERRPPFGALVVGINSWGGTIPKFPPASEEWNQEDWDRYVNDWNLSNNYMAESTSFDNPTSSTAKTLLMAAGTVVLVGGAAKLLL